MSILLTEKTKTEAAIKKARELRPSVRVIGAYGKFEVKGSKGETYHVEFSKQGMGLVGSCDCKAGRANKWACYHLASCYKLFRQQVEQRAAARAACSTPECDGEAIVDGLCQNCNEYSELSRVAQQRMAEAKEQAYVESILGPELVAQLNYKPEAVPALVEADHEAVESALVECRECGEEWPEAQMLGAGYNPVCPSCVLFN